MRTLVNRITVIFSLLTSSGSLFGVPMKLQAFFFPVVTPSPCNNLPTPDRCLQMKSHSVMAESSYLGYCGVGGFIVRGRALGT